MPETIVLKKPEDLENFATGVVTDIESLKAVIEEQKAAAEITTAESEAAKAEAAELKQIVESFEEKIKSLQMLVQSGNAPDQNTEEGKLFRLGKMVNTMHKAFKSQNQGPDAAKAGGYLEKIGAIPTVDALGSNGNETFGVRKEYEAKHRQQLITGKAAVSSDPLTSDDSDEGNFFGSYLVPVDLVADLKRIAGDASVMMPKVTHVPVRGITTYVPTTTDAMTFTKVTDQETAKTEDTVTFARSTLTVETYAFWLALTEEMDEDSLIGIGELIRQMGAEAWAAKFDDLALADSTYGSMATSGINETVMATGDSTFANVSVDYLNDMKESITGAKASAKRRGAEYFMHATVWDSVENEKDADGNYVLRAPADMAPNRIHGYPVNLTDGMPTTSAVSTSFVAFGNPRHIIAGDKTSFEFRIFDQTYSTMQFDQIFLRIRVRQAMVNTIPSAWAKLTTAAS